MEMAFVLGLALLGVAIAFRAPRGDERNWVFVTTAWLSVPIGFVLSSVIGWYVADMGGCHPSAATQIECFVYRWDVSAWINGLVFSGYAIAFYALPWFVIGGMCVLIYAFFTGYRK